MYAWTLPTPGTLQNVLPAISTVVLGAHLPQRTFMVGGIIVVKVNEQRGFTLVEILAVLLILGIIASVAAVKMVRLDDSAREVALHSGVSELNTRENMVWANTKLQGYTDDSVVFSAMDYDIGANYSWSSGPTESGGVLVFEGVSMAIIRTPSTYTSAGVWKQSGGD